MSLEEKLQSLKLSLPPCPKPAGLYQPVIISGHQAFISGQVSKNAEGDMICGRVGSELSLDQGQEAAKACALNIISIIHHLIGQDRFERIVKLTGFVQADQNFKEIPQVINGASELLAEVFGEAGKHARSAVGVYSLPMNAAVEIEAVIQIGN